MCILLDRNMTICVNGGSSFMDVSIVNVNRALELLLSMAVQELLHLGREKQSGEKWGKTLT